MAVNCASYLIRFVCRDMEMADRIGRILRYKDGEYFIYHVRSVSVDSKWFNVDGGVSMVCSGLVNWGGYMWFGNNEMPGYIMEGTGAHYTTLDILADRLGFDFEVYSKNRVSGFHEYFQYMQGRGITVHELASWCENWRDEQGNIVEAGGLKNYGRWRL